MIALSSDCLVFELNSGESIPLSAEMITVELVGGDVSDFDPEVVHHAASSVFHYFRQDLARESVTVAEFAEALEKVLRGLGFKVEPGQVDAAELHSRASDLRRLARESGGACELSFFPRLRDELRAQLRASPRTLRFRGLRDCVKHLAGARRWNSRCQSLHDQIVGYLRECLSAEASTSECSLLVE